MSDKFGWCFGAEGAIGDHDSCKHEIGTGGTILRCGCPCHEAESLAHSTREPSRIEQADEVRQHPIGSDRPTRVTEQRG